MTIRNLDKLLAPKSVAFLGASPEPASVGAIVAANLAAGGFAGPVWLVNPRHESIHGVRCYPTVAALPGVPDLGVIATPPATIPGVIAELAAKGTRAAVVITAGVSRRTARRDAEGLQGDVLAHRGPKLPRPYFAAARAQRQLQPPHAAQGRPRLPVAIGRAHHRDRRLGKLARHRLLARRVAGRHGGRRFRRSARLPRRQHAEPRDPALHGAVDAGAEVSVGRAPRRPRQAGNRAEGGAQCLRRQGRYVAHGRARGIRCRL